jgi:hypothetical protein
MTADAALQELFDDVRRTLAGAGFDVTALSTREAPGLYIRREADAVVVSWNPGEEVDAPGRHMRGQEAQGDFTQSSGIRDALHEALLVTLWQGGYAAQDHRDSGEVWVTLP